MRYLIRVTFEYHTLQPNTVPVEIEASNLGTALRKAFSVAKRAVPNTTWASVVLLAEKSTKGVSKHESPSSTAENDRMRGSRHEHA